MENGCFTPHKGRVYLLSWARGDGESENTQKDSIMIDNIPKKDGVRGGFPCAYRQHCRNDRVKGKGSAQN